MESTFDKELVMDSLANMLATINKIEERTQNINSGNDFASSPGGMLKLDAVCMNLIAIGEATKGIDKITHGQLLAQYQSVFWSGIMKMRDKIAHHYFEVDADVVYNTIKEDVPVLKSTIIQIVEGLKN